MNFGTARIAMINRSHGHLWRRELYNTFSECAARAGLYAPRTKLYHSRDFKFEKFERGVRLLALAPLPDCRLVGSDRMAHGFIPAE